MVTRRRQDVTGPRLVTLYDLTDLRDGQQEGSGLCIKNIHVGAARGQRTCSTCNQPGSSLGRDVRRRLLQGWCAKVQMWDFRSSEDIIKTRHRCGVVAFTQLTLTTKEVLKKGTNDPTTITAPWAGSTLQALLWTGMGVPLPTTPEAAVLSLSLQMRG